MYFFFSSTSRVIAIIIITIIIILAWEQLNLIIFFFTFKFYIFEILFNYHCPENTSLIVTMCLLSIFLAFFVLKETNLDKYSEA